MDILKKLNRFRSPNGAHNSNVIDGDWTQACHDGIVDFTVSRFERISEKKACRKESTDII